MSKKPRIPLKGGDEFDGLTTGKRCHHWKAGERKRIKTKYNKRMRKERGEERDE